MREKGPRAGCRLGPGESQWFSARFSLRATGLDELGIPLGMLGVHCPGVTTPGRFQTCPVGTAAFPSWDCLFLPGGRCSCGLRGPPTPVISLYPKSLLFPAWASRLSLGRELMRTRVGSAPFLHAAEGPGSLQAAPAPWRFSAPRPRACECLRLSAGPGRCPELPVLAPSLPVSSCLPASPQAAFWPGGPAT